MAFYKFAKALVWFAFHLIYRIEAEGIENIPEKDGTIICPNHFALADPLLVAIMCPRQIRFMAKYELFEIPVLRFLLRNLGVYPVKRGEADLNAFKTTLKLLKDNNVIGLFPEGTRVRAGQSVKANAGAAMFALKSGKLIVPTLITGRYRLFSKLKVKYGQPIDLTQYKKDKMTNDDYLKLSKMVLQKIYELREE